MTYDILQSERVKEWSEEHPREWWAFEQLSDEDPLRDDVLADILRPGTSGDAMDRLVRYAAALEVHERASRAGTVSSAPRVGLRRPFDIRVIDMVKSTSLQRDLFFRVHFWTDEGWSGHFDTTNPKIVERINRNKGSEPLQVVAEVQQRLYDFLVVLGGRINIV